MIQMPYDVTVRLALASLERNLLPDVVVRRFIRLLLAGRLRSGYKSSSQLQLSDLLQFVHSLRELPIAIKTDQPKAQHYELPTSFFKLVLGKNLKYRNFLLHIFLLEQLMKNYKDLLKKISGWMKQDSLLFVHHFCHKAFAYHFEDIDEDDWITRYFFTGGTMLSADLLLYFQDDVSVIDHWLLNGKHCSRTSEEWLKRMGRNIASIKPIMETTYGKDSGVKWTVYWRTFFIAVAELFGYNDGEEWMVSHLPFKKK